MAAPFHEGGSTGSHLFLPTVTGVPGRPWAQAGKRGGQKEALESPEEAESPPRHKTQLATIAWEGGCLGMLPGACLGLGDYRDLAAIKGSPTSGRGREGRGGRGSQPVLVFHDFIANGVKRRQRQQSLNGRTRKGSSASNSALNARAVLLGGGVRSSPRLLPTQADTPTCPTGSAPCNPTGLGAPPPAGVQGGWLTAPQKGTPVASLQQEQREGGAAGPLTKGRRSADSCGWGFVSFPAPADNREPPPPPPLRQPCRGS